jgi:hypothetical protein
MMIEEETGTYSGRTTYSHNGYSAGDFSNVPFTWTKLYPPYVSMPTFPQE